MRKKLTRRKILKSWETAKDSKKYQQRNANKTCLVFLRLQIAQLSLFAHLVHDFALVMLSAVNFWNKGQSLHFRYLNELNGILGI